MPLDELDLKLMEELESDARQSVKALAGKLGMKRTTVGYRLNRLLTRGIVRIACVSNTELLGHQFILVIGINVSPGTASHVMDQLTPIPAVKVVDLTAGRYNILAWATIKNRSALSQFVTSTLAGISDITSIEIINSYNWMIDYWAYFKPKLSTPMEYRQYSLSDLELSIIEAMHHHPRQTIAELAGTVGCSALTAKTQLEKLLDDGIIKIVSIVDSTALGYDMRIIILIKSKPKMVLTLAREISAHNNARHVSLITGQWQVFVEAEFLDSEHMQEYLSETLNATRGILEYEIVHIIKTVKLSTSLFE